MEKLLYAGRVGQDPHAMKKFVRTIATEMEYAKMVNVFVRMDLKDNIVNPCHVSIIVTIKENVIMVFANVMTVLEETIVQKDG
jgi:hypothetical protein